MRNFRDLRIWTAAVDLSVEVYQISKKFPKEERYGLTSQITRAAVSIASNIAEGCRGSDKELIQFLNISLGSAFEVETQLLIAQKIGYIPIEEYQITQERLQILQKQINSFRNSIKK